MERLDKNSDPPNISVVIPTFNSEGFLDLIVRRVLDALNKLDFSYELILVDDGSTDNTWKILAGLSAVNHGILGIRLKRNCGQHSATMCGIRHASGNTIVTLDDDLQHDPDLIHLLLEPVLDLDFEAAFAVFPKKSASFTRKCGSTLIQRIYRWVGHVDKDTRVSSFRSMSRSVADSVSKSNIVDPVINVEIVRVATRIKNVNLPHHDSVRKRSGYSVRQILQLTHRIIFNYSLMPLKFVSRTMAFSALLLAVFAGSVVLKVWLEGSSVPGWASQIVITTAITVPIVFTLAVIAEYLALLVAQSRSENSAATVQEYALPT